MVFLLALQSVLLSSANAKHILIYGDSLSAAYGMKVDQGWVHLLNEYLKNDPQNEHTVSNASISGETSGGGRARFELTLDNSLPDVVLLELGANDGLRGYPLSSMKKNLAEMISIAQAKDISIAIVSVSLPATYGHRYIDSFRQVFSDLAAEYDIPMIDFYLEEFTTNPEYLQEDGLHPTARIQPLIRDRVLTFLGETGLLVE